MRHLLVFLLVSFFISLLGQSCLAKYTYNQTGPEYESRVPFSPVMVFFDGQPDFPVDPVGVLAFTDPLPRKIQIEEAKRHARKKGGNVLIRVKKDGTEAQGGFTFRIARADEVQLARALEAGSQKGDPGKIPLGSSMMGNAAGSAGAVYGDFSVQTTGGSGENEVPLYKYVPEN